MDGLIQRLSSILSGLHNTCERVDSIATRVIGFEPTKQESGGIAPTTVASSAKDLASEIERIMSHIDRHLSRIDR